MYPFFETEYDDNALLIAEECIDPDAVFFLQGQEFIGVDGYMRYRKRLRSHFENIKVTVQSADANLVTDRIAVRWTLTGTRKDSPEDLQTYHGVSIYRFNGDKINSGMNSYDALDVQHADASPVPNTHRLHGMNRATTKRRRRVNNIFREFDSSSESDERTREPRVGQNQPEGEKMKAEEVSPAASLPGSVLGSPPASSPLLVTSSEYSNAKLLAASQRLTVGCSEEDLPPNYLASCKEPDAGQSSISRAPETLLLKHIPTRFLFSFLVLFRVCLFVGLLTALQ